MQQAYKIIPQNDGLGVSSKVHHNSHSYLLNHPPHLCHKNMLVPNRLEAQDCNYVSS